MVLMRSERVLQPGQSTEARLTIANDGDVPTQYAVQISPGAQRPLGFASEATVGFVTEVIEPGASITYSIPLAMPPGIAEGAKLIRVRIGEVGPTGELTGILDEEFFAGLLRVESPFVQPPLDVIPLPGEPPALPQALSFGDISLGVPIATPSEVQPGEIVTIQLPLANLGPVQVPIRLQSAISDSAGFPVLDLAPEVFKPDLRSSVTKTYTPQLPADMAPGSYGLSVAVFDPATNALLAQENFQGVFRVAGLALAPALEFLSQGDVLLGTPSVTPTEAQPGDTVTIRIPLENVGPVQAPLRVESSIINAAGFSVQDLPLETVTPQPRFSITPTSSLTLLDLPSGNYGLVVAVFEDVTNTLLASQGFPGLFTIPALEVPELPPAPELPPVPELPPGLFPGDLSLSVSTDKALYGPGETVLLRLVFLNNGPVVSDVTATAFILGPEGTSIARFPIDFTALMGVLIIRDLQWTVPSVPAEGSYGVQVFAIDPATFVSGDPQLLQDVIPNVFSVGVRPLASGDVDISAPTADPVSQQDELRTDIRFSITNTGQVQAPLEVQIIVIDSATGGPVLELLPALVMEPAIGVEQPIFAAVNMPPGSYGISVGVRDQNTRVLLRVLTTRDLFTVVSPAPPPSPEEEPAPETPFTPFVPGGAPL